MSKTKDYYNSNSDEFFNSTVNVDITSLYGHFEAFLNKESVILDVGSGSGRDTKYFLEKGYKVDAIDLSEELCKLASEFTGINVQNLSVLDLDESNKYDGIWACASLLHLKKSELPTAFVNINNAIKSNGVIYVSFKKGTFEGDRNGRYFTDLEIEELEKILLPIKLEIKNSWITSDARPGRENEKWINAILIKK